MDVVPNASRRSFVMSTLGAAAALSVGQRPERRPHVLVVGAGAFGGWTALYLLRGGARVTLLDAWGPGNARASSGGETRIIRAVYGPDRPYVELVARALELWREHERRWQRRLFHRIGMLWMAGADDAFMRAAIPLLRGASLAVEELGVDEAKRRYPPIDFDGVRWALYEPDAGYLTARLACEAVLHAVQEEGGEYRQAWVSVEEEAGELARVRTGDGATLTADHYVFACGPWLGQVLPSALGRYVEPTRQEVFFFGTPPDARGFDEEALPAWIDMSDRVFYGIPGNRWRGFKLADDTRGPRFDPTNGDRAPTPEGMRAARAYLARRFPALAGAPLLESRVCQYEQSPDGHFIIDRHPTLSNVWIVGGGSGHGFKVGPALGERVARLVLEDGRPDPFFQIERLSAKKPRPAPGS